MPSDRTIASVRLQGSGRAGEIMPEWTYYDFCGCAHRGDRWDLCQYHEGFDDAAEQADRLQGLIDAYASAHSDHETDPGTDTYDALTEHVVALLAAARTEEQLRLFDD